jgi:hypothetical protein
MMPDNRPVVSGVHFFLKDEMLKIDMTGPCLETQERVTDFLIERIKRN